MKKRGGGTSGFFSSVCSCDGGEGAMITGENMIRYVRLA